MHRALPDVNVLVALLWSGHTGHSAAQTWFAGPGHRAWATNPLTQLSALRLLTNPAITQDAVDAGSAASIVRSALRHPGHEFWPFDEAVPETLSRLIPAIRGHKQWNDAALLCHAAARDGVLVTFDSGIAALAGSAMSHHVTVLKY